jgi:phospholipid transport system substrate-binding protein
MALPVMAESPNLVVEEAAALLASQLSGREDELAADKSALYSTIDAILLPRFDRVYSAQLVLGKHWRSASNEQRQRFIDAFYGSLLRRYAEGVLEYDQDMVQILPFRGDASKSRTMVRSFVLLDDGSKVPVNYGLVKREDGWLLFDVTIEGVSYIRNYRAEIDSEIRATSLEAVIERLESENSPDTDG